MPRWYHGRRNQENGQRDSNEHIERNDKNEKQNTNPWTHFTYPQSKPKRVKTGEPPPNHTIFSVVQTDFID